MKNKRDFHHVYFFFKIEFPKFTIPKITNKIKFEPLNQNRVINNCQKKMLNKTVFIIVLLSLNIARILFNISFMIPP